MNREELFDDTYRSQLMHPEYDVDRPGKQFVLLHSFGNTELVVMLNGLEQVFGRDSGKQE